MRDLGWQVWFEPRARVEHAGEGSGTSSDQLALMSINRVRYARKHHGRGVALATHMTVVMAATLRSRQPSARRTLYHLLRPGNWDQLASPSFAG